MKLSKKKVLSIVSAVVMIAACAFIPSFVTSAELVEVYNKTNPTLDFKDIYDLKAPNGAGYQPTSKFEQGNGKYILNTNAYIFWWQYDNISYMYNKAAFNTGADSVMTIRTTVADFTGNEVGITVRENLDSNAAASMISFRPGGIFIIHRPLASQASPEYVQFEKKPPFGTENCHLKMVLNKTTGRVTCYYKFGGDVNDDNGYTSIGSKSLSFLKKNNEIYVGVSAVSTNKDKPADLTLSHFSYKLEAPEGYVVEGGDSSGSDGKDNDVKLPEDSTPPGDTLLYETFTDGDIFPKSGVTATNPYWSVLSGEPRVVLNDNKTNRYITTDAVEEPLLMTAGDIEWADYSASVEIEFKESASILDTNKAGLTLRRRDVVVGGTYCYYLVLNNRGGKQYLTLNYVSGSNEYYSEGVMLKEVEISSGEMLKGKHTLSVDIIDNVFKCYLDGNLKFTFKDMDNDIFATGCIGIISDKADAMIDNILVRKLEDPIGGEYDNQIVGNWDEPIPDYIRNNFDVR